MICPRCDNQGDIYKARVEQLQVVLNICDECDACWPEGVPIQQSNFVDLSTFLQQHGTDYRDAKLTILEDTPRTARRKS